MGLNIQIQGVTFIKKIGSLMPSGDNLVGYWLFNNDLTTSKRNKITGVDATVVGTPTIVNGALLTDKTKGLITDVTQGGEKTFIVISKFSGSSQPIGSLDRDNAKGGEDGIYTYNGALFSFIDGTARTKSTTSPTQTKVNFVASAFGDTETDLYLADGDGLIKTTGDTIGSLTDQNPIRLGAWGATQTAVVGTSNLYAALVYNKKLSQVEIQEVYDDLKNKLNTIVIG